MVNGGNESSNNVGHFLYCISTTSSLYMGERDTFNGLTLISSYYVKDFMLRA